MPLYDNLAHLYDVAFSWDVRDEVDWLIARLGPPARTVLEPACGSGRMFPAFAERGTDLPDPRFRRSRPVPLRCVVAAPGTSVGSIQNVFEK